MYESRHEYALQLLEKALQADPQDHNAKYYRGIVYSRLGLYDDAISEFEQVSEFSQDIQGLYFELGFAHYLNNNYEVASTSLLQAQTQYPRHAAAKYYLGLTYYLQKQYTKSIEPLRQAVELDTQFGASSAYLIGSALVNLQRHSEAKIELHKALEDYPQSLYRSAIEQLLAELTQQKQEAKTFAARIVLGYAYDDNVGLFPDNEPLPNNAKASDSRTTANVAMALKLYEAGSHTVQTGVELFNSRHASLSQYDLLRKSVSLDLRDNGDVFTWGMRYELSAAELDMLDYQKITAFIPHIAYQHKPAYLSLATFVYKDTDYDLAGQELRGSYNYELMYRVYWLGKIQSKRKYYGAVRYEVNNAIDNEFDHRAYTLEAGYDIGYRKGTTFRGALKFSDRDYNASLDSRHSSRVEFSAIFTYALTNTLDFEFSGLYTNNPSNDAAFDYTRSIVSTLLRWSL